MGGFSSQRLPRGWRPSSLELTRSPPGVVWDLCSRPGPGDSVWNEVLLALSSGATGKEDAAKTRQAVSAVLGLPVRCRALKTNRPKAPLRAGCGRDRPRGRGLTPGPETGRGQVRLARGPLRVQV